MSFWTAAVIIVAIIGFVEIRKSHHASRSVSDDTPPAALTDDSELRREVAELRERIKVLERIATEMNTLEAVETRRIAKEIEQLRDN